MPRELARYTTVGGVTYPPGPVSDEVAAQITSEKVWAKAESAPAKKAAAKRSDSK